MTAGNAAPQARPVDLFPPTVAEARARVAAVDPGRYARTRNAIDGDVSRLSPDVTHGFVDLPERTRVLADDSIDPLTGIRTHP